MSEAMRRIPARKVGEENIPWKFSCQFVLSKAIDAGKFPRAVSEQ
jgi:hypothetical protein